MAARVKAQIPTGEVAFAYAAPTSNAASSLTVAFPLGSSGGRARGGRGDREQ